METTSSASATPTAVPVATAEGNYHAMQSPAAKASPASGTTATHTAIQIEVVESSSKLDGSGYDKVMYDHDLVMIFPYREDGEKKEPENFTVEAFVALLTGKDQERSKRKNKIIVDPFLRIFRTTRCYLDDHGKEVLNVNEKDHSEKAEQERWEKEEELLSVEYENFVGSRNPTTEAQFCELVATAVARRVQLACGLTTRMFRSCDNDEIIMTIKADDMDLRVEADRTDYPLQVCNKPFDQRLHHDKLEALRQEIGDEEFQKSKDHLQATRGAPSDDPDTAEMDPLLISEGEMYQPELRKALHCWGHTEEADGLFVEDESCRPSKVTSRLGQFFRSLTEVSYDPRTYFSPFADYRSEPMYQPYYRRYPVKWGEKKEETLFTQKDRIRLAASIVNRHINTDALVVAEYLVGNMFALHDKVALDDLRHSWALHWLMLNQPLHKIRYYFGEKVALYFAWLGFYTKMLVFPSIAGLITFIVVEARKENAKVGRSKSSDQGYILIVFAIIVVIWSSVFAEVWKRKNHIFNAIWGLHGFHRTLRYRAQFRGTKSYNPVTDAEEMTFENRIKRRRAFMTSVLIVLIMIGIVLVALFGLFWLKFFINEEVTENGVSHAKNVSDEYRSTYTLLITGANAIQILVLNTVYRGVAKKLTEYENHRTDREYENHLIIKVFLFQFCNSFASFFYIAFLKRTVEHKCIDSSFKDDDCMTELRDQLLILFLIRIVVGNTMEVVVPYLKYRVQLYLESRTLKEKQRHNYIEEQAKLVPYEQEEAFEDYNEMVIQFGFINLFVVAFPLTPLLALANNMAEVHVDAVKLCFVHRRPFPHAAKSIGAWFYILRFMSYIALGTNCALILWTSDIFTKEEMDNTTKAFVFVLAVQICIMISVAIERTVSDMPKQLGLLMERNEHVVDMVFKNMSLGDDSGLAETAESLDLTIYPNEQWDDRVLPAVRA
ncbi:hypothetical protein Poli38472_002404 [Pythium oligandrum]|uniref:Anoctamin transmembrane domain-containing protein n=1 Tax=Pythium oligandrum TaxID=41045 RepID=A0A8K1FMA3_PYTOL|nr:hypothetical protein Poli38472_002404 [Pythium oligandrum]|eukprot:TMW63463.1 hypothetical protein Poli38472_002404 [Pythium oligandrum]